MSYNLFDLDPMYDDGDYDNLGVCPSCGDRETIGGELCWSCREQDSIDNDDYDIDDDDDYEPSPEEIKAFLGLVERVHAKLVERGE